MNERDELVMDTLELARFVRMQPHHKHRKSVVIARLLGLWLSGQPVPRYRGLRLLAAGRYGWRQLLTSVRGTMRRIRTRANRETISDWTAPR
jgi:hypothetical protein